MLYTGFQHVEGTGYIHVKRGTWKILAMQQPHSCQVEYVVYALKGFIENVSLAYVASEREYRTSRVLQAMLDIFHFAACKVVVNDHLFDIILQQLTDQEAAYEASTTDDEYS